MATKKQAPRKRGSGILTPELNKLKADVTKNYGAHVVRHATEMIPFTLVSTGIFNVDLSLLGGIPDGYMSMYYGWESVGKTSFALLCGKEAMLKYPNKKIVFIDAETHLDILWVQQLGVDLEKLDVVSDAGMAEAYADILEGICLTGEPSMVIFDSIASLVPEDRTLKSAFDDEKMANLAKLAGKMFSGVTHARQILYKKGLKPPTVLFINQYRASMARMGVPTTLPSGNAQHFMMMTKLEFKRPKLIVGEDNIIIGNEHKFEVKKSKSGLSTADGSFKFVRSEHHPRLSTGAIDESPSVLKQAKKYGFYTGGGAKRKLTVFGDETFRIDEEMCLMLDHRPTEYRLLKASIIAKVRELVGKPMFPIDGNLCNTKKADVLAVIKAAADKTNEKTGSIKK